VGRHPLDGDVLAGHAVGGRRDVMLTQPNIDLKRIVEKSITYTIFIF